MADTGFKSSQDGHDVYEAEKYLGFISTHQHLMVYQKAVANSTAYRLTHGLGYAPAFDGYIKQGRQYFLNYMVNPGGYQFENTLTGKLYVDNTTLYADCSTANALVYLCYLNPIVDSAGNNVATIENVGIKFSKINTNVLKNTTASMALNTAYQCPMIVSSGTATVVVDSISASGTTVSKSNYIDVAHGQPQARHVICPDFYEKVGTGGFAIANFYPAPIGLTAPYVTEDYEMYVDDTKIRFRVSRTASSPDTIPGDEATASAKTVDFHWHMTNIILPS